jgi:putative hydrolase of the HAD superfamily
VSPSVVLFDALGTLIHLEPPAPRLRSELERRFGMRITPAESERAIAAEITYYRSHFDQGRDEASVRQLRRHCAAVLGSSLPHGASLPIDELTDTLLASLEFTVFADVQRTLETLRARGTRLIVVSNWDVSLHDALGRLGVTPLLNGVLTSAEAGVRKPSPAIFGQALTIAEASASEALHVGDSVTEDVAGAREAGIEAVLLRRDGRPGPAGVRTVTTLTELLE